MTISIENNGKLDVNIRCAYGCAKDALEQLSNVTPTTSTEELKSIWAGFSNAATFLNEIAFKEYD